MIKSFIIICSIFKKTIANSLFLHLKGLFAKITLWHLSFKKLYNLSFIRTNKFLLLTLFIALFTNPCFPQQYSNLRKKTIQIADSVKLDTLSIIPGSEIVKNLSGIKLPDSVYYFDYNKAFIIFKPQYLTIKQAEIVYRVFPLNFSDQYPKHPLLYKKTNTYTENPFFYNADKNMADTSKTGLNVSGNISRGVRIGNSQNMSVNSNLNLQLSGNIANNLEIEALLSDKNIPVQPDGYTQQVGEFDQVYIRIYDSLRSLQMGDVEINATNSHFLKFNKRILGGNFTGQNLKFGESTKVKSQISAAISKGNYNRNEFVGIEGVQGPYQLKGAKNESFIIILAGTEKIYLDGIELKRGEENDYVINYNTAELSFTPKHYITKNSRIIAEFEYSDKNYNRFVFYTQNEIINKRTTYNVHYFAEGDAKNQPINQQLNNEQKHILSSAGSNPLKAITNNFDSVEYNAKRVQYKLTDTTVNSVTYDSILVYSTNPNNAFYRAGFALVGENNGNYIQLASSANGRVFQWVAPINGIPQGSYEPVQLLIAPQKQQMIVASTNVQISPNTSAYVEMAFADKDVNTFSELNETRNTGFAISNKLNHTKQLNKYILLGNLSYEYKQKKFNTIERYRNAEFNRDWNLTAPVNNNEHYLQTSIGLLNLNKKKIAYSFEHLNYGMLYTGIRSSMLSDINFKLFNLKTNAAILNNKTNLNKSQFYKHKITLSRSLWRVVLGVHHDFENNQINSLKYDSLLINSKKYSVAEVFISSTDSSQNQFKISYKNRLDYLPIENQFTANSETDDIICSFTPETSSKHQLTTMLTWRKLRASNKTPINTSENDQNLLSRIDHKYNSNKRAIGLYSFYEIGTGMENRKEFSYIEVPVGQGIYIWNDYNFNGTAELDEFEISPFPEEANYLRIYTPTNDYIKVYTLKYNETIKLSPEKIWRNKTGIRKLLAKFNNTFSFRASHKHIQSDLASRINPLPGYVTDTAQINRSISLHNTLSFNRTNPKFGMDYTYNQQNYKLLQNNGFDITETYLQQIKTRWNITSDIMLANTTSIKKYKYNSDFFLHKNYVIKSDENKSSIQWQPTTKFRLILHYKINQKNNITGTEYALLQEAGPEMKLNAPKKGLISIKSSIIVNEYNGNLSSPITYNMLEGFQPGENYRWTISYSRNINNFLRLNLTYNGRKPNNNSVIHTGQFSISAVF